MINSVKQAIVDKLSEIYPTYTVYDEDIPQKFNKPSFLIVLINQDYGKRMNRKFKSTISFDISYFTDKSTAETKEDCLNVQLNLFRSFDLIDNFRVANKQATITDNVLHFTFDVNYSEIKTDTEIFMKTQQTNTNL